MKTVIIENDSDAMTHLENTLEDIELTTVVGKYTSTKEAEREIFKLNPELIILEPDIEPVNGLVFAKKIEQEINDIKVIFVAESSEYAVEAFDLTQVDYVLKPFNQKRLAYALKKLSPNYLDFKTNLQKIICCFKNLNYIEMSGKDDFKQIELKWRTKNSKEIFAYLVSHRDVHVRKDVLINLFWSEEGLKEAYHNLYTNIYFIRKTLADAKTSILINNHDNYYSLDLKNVRIDFEFWLEQVESYKHKDLAKLERAMDLYKGHFLQEEGYLWAEYKHQKYRLIWLETLEYIIDEYHKQKNIPRAIINALYLQKLEPYMEKTYYYLMDLFRQINDYTSVKRQYKSLEKMLKEEYGTKPKHELNYYLMK